jgi:AcrR family transcriptional regulator
MTEKAPSRRRRSEDLQKLVLSAARDLFVARGYQRTSMREIAAEAGVAQAVIYRNFGNKQAVFEQAVAEPFHSFMESFIQTWRMQIDNPRPNRDMTELFVRELYEFLAQNRDLMLALITYRRYDSDLTATERASVIGAELGFLEQLVVEDADRRGWFDIDPPITARCSFGLVFSLSVLDELIFPLGRQHPSKERIIREIVAFISRGVEGRRL